MKVIKETFNSILYENKEGDLLIALKLHNSKATPVCSSCGNERRDFYIIPELHGKALCDVCFKKYSKEAKFDIADLHSNFNTLILNSIKLKDSLEQEDLELVNTYFKAHSEREKIDIYNFIDWGK